MALKKSEQLKAQMQEKWQEIKSLQEKVTGEDREYSQDERDLIEKTLDKVGEIEVQVRKEQADEALAARIGEVDQMFAGIGSGSKQRQAQLPPAVLGQKRMSLGQRLVESPEWKSWFKQMAPNGRIPENLKGIQSPAIEVKDFGIFQQKDLITGLADDSAGAFIQPDITGIYEPIGHYPTMLRQLISVRTTTSDTVEFVRQTKQVSEAAPTPEANVKYPTGYPGEITGRKPQGSMYFEPVRETVKTIAVYVGATKRALSDMGQLRGLIDQELRADLIDELEDQLFNGNGIGENFTGLNIQPGTLVQPFNTDVFVTTRQALTTLLVVGRQMPTAYVFNPSDWETVDLMRDNTTQFFRGSPFLNGPTTLWGVPVVQSFHQAAGNGWVANWKKAVLWDREQATITATDSHDDWFVRNLIAILAELRAAFGLIRPQAFVQVPMA